MLCRLYNKKNDWEKRRPVADAGEDTGSESLRTPESDVENEVAPPEVAASAAPEEYAASSPEFPRVVKEDNDWFMDLNLDDLQSSFMAFNGAAPVRDLSYQDYLLAGLASPQLRPGIGGLPPF